MGVDEGSEEHHCTWGQYPAGPQLKRRLTAILIPIPFPPPPRKDTVEVVMIKRICEECGVKFETEQKYKRHQLPV